MPAATTTSTALAHPALTLGLLLVLATLVGLVGCTAIPFFSYTSATGETYGIGALGYWVDGRAVSEKYHYAAPSSWPSPLTHAPLLLLIHLPLFILLALVLLYYLVLLVRPAGAGAAEPLKRVERAPTAPRVAQLAVGAAALIIVVCDAAMWGIADHRGEVLTGAPLGFAVVIAGPVLLVLWAANQSASWLAYRAYVARK
ncbi:hypothetical protein Q5752_004859 [Cryptotrichosporon argae]